MAEPKRILVTGSRRWSDEDLVRKALTEALDILGDPDDPILVSGNCPTGADRIAEELWESAEGIVERHPADWEKRGRAAGPIRNQEMVDLGADVCVAFLMEDSKGTVDCIRRARKAGILVLVVREDGSETRYG